MFQILIGITALAALLSFINAKFLKLSGTIGILILSIIISFSIGSSIYLYDKEYFMSIYPSLKQIDFRKILFDFLLGILLFAGAIHVNLNSLLKEKGSVIIYATFGVLVSTFIIGTIFYYLVLLFGFEISFFYSLVFGALVSPTDPVAVLALLKKAGAPEHMEIKIVGESLFNDGIGIVVFLSLLSLATLSHELEITHIAQEFSIETGGGILMGLILGYLGKISIRSVSKEPIIAVHISLAIVLGGYSLSSLLHISGAIAMVVAGLIVGDSLHSEKFSEEFKNHMNIFWEILDEIFNAILFVLIGIIIIMVDFNIYYLLLGGVTIIIVLLSRYIAIYLSNFLLKKSNRANAKERIILTWAGLKGGISIALALTLPDGETRDIILYVTYVVVVFSIITQGLTIEKLISKSLKK